MLSSLSSSRLTEEERRRKEASQRRILRIQQVREQEKQYSLKLLDTHKKQKSSQQNQILSEIKDEWEAQKCENIAKLQAKIDYAITHVGIAQADANYLTLQQAKVATRAYGQLMEARVQEAKRFDIAYEWAQSSNRQREVPTLQKKEWRANAMMAEKERAKMKVAQTKAKTNSQNMSQKENIIVEPKGPQVIKGKVAPHTSNRAGVSYASTRFHETMHDEKPDSPAKNRPLPTPKDPVHILEENAYTAAITIEQAELMRADQEREERARKAQVLQQRTIIAHTKFITERQGKEAERALAQFEQVTRRQKAQQIGELARVVERHVEVGDNPVGDEHLNSEFSHEDGMMGLSWSSLPREKVAKGRKSKINRAFEEEFFSPVLQASEEPDKVSVDIDIFSNFSDLPTPPSQAPPVITPKNTNKPLTTIQKHTHPASTSIAAKPSTSTLKRKITKAKQPINITKATEIKENNVPMKDPSTEPTNDQHSPVMSDENLLEDYPLSYYLTPSLPLEPNVTLDTTDRSPGNQIHHSHFTDNTEEVHKRSETENESSESESNAFPPPLSPPSPPPFLSPPSTSSPALPLHTRDAFVSEEYLRDFERKMRELDEYFHRALGYPPSHPPPSHPPLSHPPPHLPPSHPIFPSPYSAFSSPQPALQPVRQPHSSFTAPTLQQSPPLTVPLLSSQQPSPPLSSQHPSPRQSSPPPQVSHHPSLPHQPPVAPFVYHTSSSPNISPPSLSPQSTPPKSLPYNYLLDNTSHSFATSYKPIPNFKDNSTPLTLPFGASIDDYPVFTFVLDSPQAPAPLLAPLATPPRRPRDEDDDIFSISPLSSNPSPCIPSPPRSPYLSSPLSNHSLSYSTDSLFMST